MNTQVWRRELENEAQTTALGAELAILLRPGDFLALRGDLGTGKTALARAIIYASGLERAEEVPSPTFTLVQSYDQTRIPIWHFDLYRLQGPEEIFELGFEEAEDTGVCLVEWPDKMAAYLPVDYLEIALEHAGTARRAVLRPHGSWAARLARAKLLHEFLISARWQSAKRTYLLGDASTRSYEKLLLGGETRILMNAPPHPDGPPLKNGKSYSALAHLAEDMTSFSALSGYLRRLGLSAPEIYAQDLKNGFLLLEDLGDDVFPARTKAGKPMSEPYKEAIEVLHVLHMQRVPDQLPLTDGAYYTVPHYDRQALFIELELLIEWFWPYRNGAPVTQEKHAQYLGIWQNCLSRLSDARTLTLRDYHSPNLLWLAGREGVARAGLIDFQDALIGSPAYDLVSLLQDARVDVPRSRENTLRAAYMDHMNMDELAQAQFLTDYALLGAQRAAKILGIFVRLAKRDGKPGYLRHIPRIEAYLERNLQHSALEPIAKWFAGNLPIKTRIK